MDLVTDIYRMTRSFPAEDRFALAVQLQKAAASVPSNIAEAYGRYTRRDCASFLVRSRGSAYELETQVIIARNLNYVSEATVGDILNRIAEVNRMLNALIRYFRRV